MKKVLISMVALAIVATSFKTTSSSIQKKNNIEFPDLIQIQGLAQNPEGIEFDKNDNTFLLSSMNAAPIVKVALDGTFKVFTSGEKFPLSTAGLEVDYDRNRLLVAGFNGMELMDKDPNTKGVSFLRVYNLKTGIIEKDVNLSYLVPDAPAFMANDVAVDNEGNAYISDWYAGVVYKVDVDGKASIFWKNNTGIPSGANGIDFHTDGYLLVSLVSVNEKGLYANYGLVKIPVKDAKAANVVDFTNRGFTGFDGMQLDDKGNLVGVTNNGTTPGGNTLIKVSSNDHWKTATVINAKAINASTTVAITPSNEKFVINQDFTKPMKEDWTIEKIKF